MWGREGEGGWGEWEARVSEFLLSSHTKIKDFFGGRGRGQRRGAIVSEFFTKDPNLKKELWGGGGGGGGRWRRRGASVSEFF